MWKTKKNYDKICGISRQDLTADSFHSPVQERVKTRSCYSKKKDKNRVNTVPLTKDRVQMRLSRLKQISPEKALAQWKRKEVIKD